MEENAVQTVKTAKRSFVGLVTSDKMDKTIVVLAKFKEKHPIYGKFVQVLARS